MSSMSRKRKLSSHSLTSDVHDDPVPSSDRPAADIASKVDPTYGQRSALPCGGDDADSFEAMEYLRSVRSEASSIPNLLVAPIGEQNQDVERENIYADYPTAFYYRDGAYIAHSTNPRPPSSPTSNASLDPQESYYIALISRFRSVQQSLQTPPEDGIDHRAKVLLFRKRSSWRSRLLSLEPTMRLLASLDQDTVIYGLSVLCDVLTRGNLKDARKGRCLGAWAWGLLARCREVGMMDSEGVGVVRLLGKQAGFVLRREGVEGGARGNSDEAEVEEEVSGDEEKEEIVEEAVAANGEDDTDEALEKRRRELLEMLNGEVVETNGHQPDLLVDGDDRKDASAKQVKEEDMQEVETSRSKMIATLDVILTIVGEVYGQRDLLDCRLLWEEM